MSRGRETLLGCLGVLGLCLIAVFTSTPAAEGFVDGKQIIIGSSNRFSGATTHDIYTGLGTTWISQSPTLTSTSFPGVRLPVGILNRLKVQVAVDGDGIALSSGTLIVTVVVKPDGGSPTDTLLTCTVAFNDSDLGCENTVNDITINFGDRVAIKFTSTFNSGSNWTFTYTAVFD